MKENRIDDASDAVINKRMEVFEKETRPTLDFYPKEIVHRIDATMSQIRILSEIVAILVPLKEGLDRDKQARQSDAEASAASQLVTQEAAARIQEQLIS